MTQIAVCGPKQCTAEQASAARRVGELLAEAGAVVICGGESGVMAAVAAGARSRNGVVVGVRPDAERGNSGVRPDAERGNSGARPDAERCVQEPSDYTAVLLTNMGQARNAIIVNSADAVVCVGGSWGTLCEMALAMRRGVPVISLDGWRVVDAAGVPVLGVITAATAEEAVAVALRVGATP